jgi:peptide deformylase
MEFSVKVYGDPILRTDCDEVDSTESSKQAVLNLGGYLSKMQFAVGLAAPQVGLKMRVFSMLDNKNDLLTIVNPQIIKRSGNMSFSEGCLSIPNVFAKTEMRHKYLTATYFDENFNRQTRHFRGTEAVVFQHEYDHLNGILFIDHLTKEGREKINDVLSKIERHVVRSYHPEISSKFSTFR